MLNRALWSAWRRRSASEPALGFAVGRHFPTLSRWSLQPFTLGYRNALTRYGSAWKRLCFGNAQRGFGTANVWVDEATTASRATERKGPPRKIRGKLDPGGKPEEAPVRVWRDGKVRNSRLAISDTGKLLGRHRRVYIAKYGMPKRIPKKVRQTNEVKRTLDVENQMKRKKGPSDSGVARRIREKRLYVQKKKKRLRALSSEENSAPSPSSEKLEETTKVRKVMTLFGEIDVTSARRLREAKAKQLPATSGAVHPAQVTVSAPAKALKLLESNKVKICKPSKAESIQPASKCSKPVDSSINDSGALRLNEKAGRMLEEAVEKKPAQSPAVADWKKIREPSDTGFAIMLESQDAGKKPIQSTANSLTFVESNQVAAAEHVLELTKNRINVRTDTAVAMLAERILESHAEIGAAQEKKKKSTRSLRDESHLKKEADLNEADTTAVAKKKKTRKLEILEDQGNMFFQKRRAKEEKTSIRDAEENHEQIDDDSRGEIGLVKEKRTAKVASLSAVINEDQKAVHDEVDVVAAGKIQERLEEQIMAASSDRAEGTIAVDWMEGDDSSMVITKPSRKSSKSIEVELLEQDDMNEKLTWTVDSRKRLDETYSGLQLAKALGTNTLMGFPRLTKVKKVVPDTNAAEEDEKVLRSAAKLDPTERRSIKLRRELEEKAMKNYQLMVRAEEAAPAKKKWVNRRIKVDPNDTTFKRYDDSEEHDLGSVALKPLGTNAMFRAIQPSLHLVQYLDSQMLGRRRLDEWRKAGYNVKLYAPLDNVPFTKGGERHKIQQPVFRNPHVFIAAAEVSSSIPIAELPEIAFAGRSNAGKSSLLNALTRKWGSARTSPRPGKTQSINFYVLGTKLCMVDLPGYSFAYGKEEKIEQIRQLMRDYITLRDELKRICVLVDAKWGFRKKDQEFIDFLETINRKYQIVLTKTDLISPMDLARRATQIEEVIKDAKSHIRPVLMVSSKSGAGIGKLRMSLASVLD